MQSRIISELLERLPVKFRIKTRYVFCSNSSGFRNRAMTGMMRPSPQSSRRSEKKTRTEMKIRRYFSAG